MGKEIYNSESFANVINDINGHISKIKDCFNSEFVLSSYTGSKAGEIETSLNNILLDLKNSMNDIDNINVVLNYYKETYDNVVNSNRTSVGGE